MRVWFNHWFSTAYHLIRLMRAGAPTPLYVLGSSRNPFAVYRAACDEWRTEPECGTDAEYAAFCLDFCREHDVDVLVPRRGLAALAERRDQFARLGVRLLCGGDAALLRALEDKARTYALLAERGFADLVPDHRVVRSLDEFRQARADLRRRHERLCYKLTEDEGAVTFRVLDETLEAPEALRRRPGAKLSPAAAERILDAYDFSVPVLLMPWLEGPEISADCLMTAQGPLVLPRRKTDHRYSVVSFDPAIIDLCRRIVDNLGLEAPLNLQFRAHRGGIFLLEINPRMSGGLQLACEATGINVPALALGRLLGREQEWRSPGWRERRVAHIETPICLDDPSEPMP